MLPALTHDSPAHPRDFRQGGLGKIQQEPRWKAKTCPDSASESGVGGRVCSWVIFLVLLEGLLDLFSRCGFSPLGGDGKLKLPLS